MVVVWIIKITSFQISLKDKSLEDLYITFNVDNTLTEVIETIKSLKEDSSVESKPEETPETKPEVNPGESGNVGNTEEENNTENNSTGSNDKLPQTGAPVSSAQVIFMALVITTIGVVVLKKKENIV